MEFRAQAVAAVLSRSRRSPDGLKIAAEQILLLRIEVRLAAHFGHPGLPLKTRVSMGVVGLVAAYTFGGVKLQRFIGLDRGETRRTGSVRIGNRQRSTR